MKKLSTVILGLSVFFGAAAQTNNVSTVVVSAETGEPVSGASVVVTGTNIATTTDINGRFSIDAPAQYKTLTISHNNLQPAVINILPDPIVMKKANGLASGWGVELGLSSAKWKYSIEDDDDDDYFNDLMKRRKAFTVGVTYNYPIAAVPNFSVMGGLFYAPKGWNFEYKEDGYRQKTTVTANYLELQALARYAYTLPVLNNDLKAFAMAGPYVAYGLGGKIKVEENDWYEDEEDLNSERKTFDYLKRFDMGLTLGIGVEYKRYSLTCRWGLGLLNCFSKKKASEAEMKADYAELKDKMTWDEFKNKYGSEYSESDYDGESVKNRSFSITLGYRF